MQGFSEKLQYGRTHSSQSADRSGELAGLDEPSSLVSIVGNIKVPVLLIASNNPGELTEDQAYCNHIGWNAVLWYVPDAGHIEALITHPQDYTSRVITFLNAALFHED